MQYFIDGIAWAIGFLQFATVIFLAIAWDRRYGFVFGYCLLQVITSVAEAVVGWKLGAQSKPYAILFWTDEMALDILLFFILILLTFRALDEHSARQPMAKLVGVVTGLVLLLPFILYKGAFVRMTWFDSTSQMLNFGAAILNLLLWTALLVSRSRDRRLLKVSAGFGIIASGVAICFGLRRLVHTGGSIRLAVNMIFLFAHLIGTAILCWAFRPSFKRRAAPVVTSREPNDILKV